MINKNIFRFDSLKKYMGLMAACTIVQAFAVLSQAIFLAISITMLWQRKPFTNTIIYIAAFAISFIVRQLMGLIKNLIMQKVSSEISDEYRVLLLEKYANVGPSLVLSRGTGSSISLLINGLDNVKKYVELVIIKMLDLAIIPIVLLVYIFWLDWKLGSFLLVIYPLIILFFIILGIAAQSKAESEYANFKNLNNRFVDILRGLTTLKQLGLSKKYGHQLFKISEQYRKSTMKTLKIAITSTFSLDFFTTLSIAVVAVFLGLDLMNGKVALLPALTILIISPEYFLPLRMFAEDYHATLDGKNTLEEIENILEVTDPDDTNVLTLDTFNETTSITLNEVCVKYPDTDVNNLNDISLNIKGYQKIALVGESGSGKTTLLETLAGFLIPTTFKEIKINNQHIPHFRQHDWEKQFFYMPQKPYIFHDTLRNNISFYSPHATDEQIKEAATKAGLRPVIDSLDNGLNTIIGEGARQLSGGQAQRVALARMFLSTARHVLLFDEPTAHLDIETEYELKKTMSELFKNHLVVFATHRLHWINEMDCVIVMRQGKIVEVGNPKELLNNKNSELCKFKSELI